MNMKMAFAAATLALASPLAVNAATITAGENGDYYMNADYVEAWDNGGKTWTISDLTFSAAFGYSALTVYVNGTAYPWQSFGTGTSASLALGDFVISSPLLISVDYQGTALALGTYAFSASEALSEVPVPAAGLLLATALAGFGVASRRKKD